MTQRTPAVLDSLTAEQARRIAVWVARSRGLIGILSLVTPGLLARSWIGAGGGTPAAKAITRLFGVREVGLALGTMIAVEASERGADWLSIAALVDAGDAAVCFTARGLRGRGRLAGLAAAATAATQFALAQRLAVEDGIDERAEGEEAGA